MEDTSLAGRIATSRIRAGLTQQQLAELVGLAQSSIGDLESGKSRTTTKIGSLARAMSVDAYWLETGDLAGVPDGVAEPPYLLSSEETRILALYRAMPTRKRKAMVEFVTHN